jgi:plasmid stability protein
MPMSILNIRNLPEEVHRRLRVRAAKAGRSMEAEARAILTTACSAEEMRQSANDLQGWVADLYGPKKPRRVVEKLLAERRKESAKE